MIDRQRARHHFGQIVANEYNAFAQSSQRIELVHKTCGQGRHGRVIFYIAQQMLDTNLLGLLGLN